MLLRALVLAQGIFWGPGRAYYQPKVLAFRDPPASICRGLEFS
jgi:hypothetical protein